MIGHVITDSGSVTNATLQAGAAVIGGVELVDSGGTNKASISAGGAVKVDGSAVTQPVSGTVTANQGTVTDTAPATQNITAADVHFHFYFSGKRTGSCHGNTDRRLGGKFCSGFWFCQR